MKDSDIVSAERKLHTTMDMIIGKKKRLVMQPTCTCSSLKFIIYQVADAALKYMYFEVKVVEDNCCSVAKLFGSILFIVGFCIIHNTRVTSL